LFACNKTNETQDLPAQTTDLTTKTAVEELSTRIDYLNQPVIFEGKSKSLNYNLVAGIQPAEINGVKLSATCVVAADNKAWVSFHTKGSLVGGELLTIDITEPATPVIVQSAQSESHYFNDVYKSFDNQSLLVCGDQKNENNVRTFFAGLNLDENSVPESNFGWVKNSNASSGNSITYTNRNNNQYLWMTNGSNG